MYEHLDNIPDEHKFTIAQFAEKLKLDDSAVRYMIKDNRLPEGFTLLKLSERKRYIVKEEAIKKTEKPKYIHPSELQPDVIVKIDNCMKEQKFFKPSGGINISKIAKAVNQHYYTIYYYLNNKFKDSNEARADKGLSRKFKKYSKSYRNQIQDCFNKHYLESAIKNTTQAIRLVERELGETIPRRLAGDWAKRLDAPHEAKHQYKRAIKKHIPHWRNDNWGEIENFLDVVQTDVWKIDVPFVDEETRKKIDEELDELKKKNIKQWEKQRTKALTAYLLSFIDLKTRKPLQAIICAHSVSAQDVKKGMMLIMMEFGEVGKWYLDNGHEYINDKAIQFLYGMNFHNVEFVEGNENLQLQELKEADKLVTSKPYSPYGKGCQERMFGIIKERWASYHIAYSPNQVESRKPTLRLSAVQPTLKFEELGSSLKNYLDNEYINEERPDMFLDPRRTKDADVNRDRPKSIIEAFDRAWMRFEKKEVDSELLAYHYADKFKGTFRNGSIIKTYKTFVLQYVPYDNNAFDLMFDYAYREKAVTVIINPQNIFQAWFYDGRIKICEARDERFNETMGWGYDRATYRQKIQQQAERSMKRAKKKIEEYESIKPENIYTKTWDENSLNPQVEIKNDSDSIEDNLIEQYFENEDNEIEINESDSESGNVNIWDLDL